MCAGGARTLASQGYAECVFGRAGAVAAGQLASLNWFNAPFNAPIRVSVAALAG